MVVAVALGILCACACALAFDQARGCRRLEAELDRARDSVRIDELTTLRTRRTFIEELELEVMRVARTGQPSSVVVISIAPPRLEEAEADARRRVFAQVLRSEVRTVDIGYRVGPDEFALILPDTRARGGMVAAGRIEESFIASGAGAVTAGVAEAGPGIDAHHLFRHAYHALMAAGRRGHSTVLAYSRELERGSEADGLERLGEIEPAHGSSSSPR
jgi:diguanylate cyclase (GGDEF)-like protein